MILCVTPNPAVDRTLIVPRLRPGEVLRARESIVAAGGKGLNVARVARMLGGTAACAGFLGGHSGRLVAELAEREGLSGAWTWIAGETRTCVILVEASGHDATVVNEPGPPVTTDDWRRLTDQIVSISGATTICLSGSLPPESDPRDYAALLARLRPAERPVWADTSGAALAAAAGVPRVAIKVNGDEAGELIGARVKAPAEAYAAARELHQRTGGPVVLTLGGAGAVLADAAGGWRARPPALQIVSSVGSGDAFLGGLVVAQDGGVSLPEALRHAVAAGAANALSVGGGRMELRQFRELLGHTSVAAI
jgi:1-phosphofructokinase family hexose kinase